MGDADFWELLHSHGISPDSATAIVQSHRGLSDADLWERVHQNGASPDDATAIVHARGGGPGPTPPPRAASDVTAANVRPPARPDQPEGSITRDLLAAARAYPGTGAILGSPNNPAQPSWKRMLMGTAIPLQGSPLAKSDMPILARQGMALSEGALPGSLAAGTYLASKFQGRPYAETARGLNDFMGQMPTSERLALNVVGGIPTAGLAEKAAAKWGVPAVKAATGWELANPVARGAVQSGLAGGGLAAANRALQPTPESFQDRLTGTLETGVFGSALGAGGGAWAPIRAARTMAKAAPNAAIDASNVAANVDQMNETNYGKVKAEAALHPSTPGVRTMLAHPELAPDVAAVNSELSTRDLNDTQKLQAVRARLSEEQSGLHPAPDQPPPGKGARDRDRTIGILKEQIDKALTEASTEHVPAVTQTIPGQPQTSVLLRNRSTTGQGIVPVGKPLRPALGLDVAGEGAEPPMTPAQQRAMDAFAQRAAPVSTVPSTSNVGPANPVQQLQLRGAAPPSTGGTPHTVFVSPATPPTEQVVTPATSREVPAATPSQPAASAAAAQAKRNAEAAALFQRTGRRWLSTAQTPTDVDLPVKKETLGDLLTGRLYGSMDPGQKAAGQKALLSEIKEYPRGITIKGRTFPTGIFNRAAVQAPRLLEQAGNPAGPLTEYLRNLSLSATTSPFTHPQDEQP